MNNISISVRAIIEYDGKFLLVKQKSFGSADLWCLPGGRMEPGENIISALERELIEEINVKPEIGNLIYIHQIKEADGTFSIPGFYFHIKNAKDYLKHNINQSSHGTKELEMMEWVDITKVNVLPKFLASELPKISQHDFNVNTKIRFS